MKLYIVLSICFASYLLGVECAAQCKIILTYADINEITRAIFTVAYPGIPVYSTAEGI